ERAGTIRAAVNRAGRRLLSGIGCAGDSCDDCGADMTCCIEGCARKVYGRMPECKMHYERRIRRERAATAANPPPPDPRHVRPCPVCKAAAGEPCTMPATGIILIRSGKELPDRYPMAYPHPQRL